MNDNTQEAFATLQHALHEDGDYAHSWHCNIAMMCYDAIREAADEIPHEQAHLIGNEAATRFMKLCFDIDTKAQP